MTNVHTPLGECHFYQLTQPKKENIHKIISTLYISLIMTL